jgi:predicted ester cyclase
MRGTHQGEWGGIKPTNKVLTLRGVNVQKFRDGRIVEQWGGANTFEALLEIGAIRLPGDASD